MKPAAGTYVNEPFVAMVKVPPPVVGPEAATTESAIGPSTSVGAALGERALQRR